MAELPVSMDVIGVHVSVQRVDLVAAACFLFLILFLETQLYLLSFYLCHKNGKLFRE